ncbi:MAG: ABC transporter ATP-binding protein [Flavobacteriales bacterium]|nr:ABC transporter ATP-binding protein [Flavobacteriales bacterium]
MKPLLHASGVAVGYPGRSLIRDASFELHGGEMAALIGLNGTGKSTLLRALAGLRAPDSGTVEADGVQLTQLSAVERARTVSMVLAGRPSAGLMDVRSLVGLGRQPWTGMLGALSDRDKERVEVALQQAGVEPFADRLFGSLSDGEAQKALIARALAQDAPIMLLDEPTAHLDLVNRISVMRLLRDVSTNGRKAVLLATHDLTTALELCDRIALLHEGSLWWGTPAEVIASGLLATAFAKDGMRFDAASGTLRATTEKPLQE